MTFNNLEELHEYIVKYAQNFIYNKMKLTGKYTIVFDDKKNCRCIACTNKHYRTIIFYDLYLSVNLNNLEFVNDVIEHECIHLIADINGKHHGADFKKWCAIFGIKNNTPYTTTQHIVPVKTNTIYFTCIKCGEKQTITKNKLTRLQKKYWFDSGFNLHCAKCKEILKTYKNKIDYNVPDKPKEKFRL